jgi:DNA-binding GntR family transcriptional regulator
MAANHPMTTSAPSSARSLTSLAFERLRGDILSGQLQPGEKLRVQALSERYGIGATAIREALSRLVTDDFVSSEDQRGFWVAPVSREDLIDLTQTRIELECLALSHAIERGGVDWESDLLSSYHRLSRTPPPTSAELAVAWNAVHRQFHEALLAGCQSPCMLRLCRLLYDRSERYRNLANRHTRKYTRDPAAEHRAIMDAVMGRDAAAGGQLLAAHYWETTDIVLNATFGGRRRPDTERARPKTTAAAKRKG